MLVRKARAPKNWREFFFEAGAIVVGVAVALGGQQVGEAVKWHHQVHEAETTMNRELGLGANFAYARMAAEPCIKAEQDAIEHALIANRDQSTAMPIMDYIVPRFVWSTDAWESARALQISGHMPTQTLLNYTSAYFFQNQFNIAAEQEEQVVARLKTLQINAGHLEPAERDRLFLALQEARRVGQQFRGTGQYLKTLKTLDVTVSDGEKNLSQPVLAALTKQFPGCVKAPDGF